MAPLLFKNENEDMKKLLFSLMAVMLSTAVMTSCGGKKEAPADEVEAPAYVFTREDTTKVHDLVNQFTVRLQNGDIAGAVDMLRYLNGDSIQSLDQAFRQRQGHSLMFVAGKAGYELNRIVFNSNIDNEAKIDIVLFEKEEGDSRPNTTSFYLRPVRIDDEWYLTTKDNITDTHSDMSSNNDNL